MNLTSFEKMLEQNDSTDIALSLIDPFPGHPFRVQEDAEMEELVESIREHGVLTPVILRKHGAGRYQIVAGHRRCFASRKLQKETVPAVVKELSEEEAVIWMVDSNIQRTDILPSEKAKAYRMKMDALSKQGCRTDLVATGTSRQLVGKWQKEVAEQVGTENGDSGRQVQRYLRLNYLIPDLLDRVDQKSLAFLAGVEHSYLAEDSQKALSEFLTKSAGKVSLKQARHLKEQEQHEKQGTLTREAIRASLFQPGKKSAGIREKGKASDRADAAGKDAYKKYFPSGYSAKERDRVICSLLEKWKKGEITV